jgi:poly-gamma-glutamate synthesis protein (capsule biosynthesis protein)
MTTAQVKAYLRVVGPFRGAAARHSRPGFEGNGAYMSDDEKLWWGYKRFIRPVEEPEPGKGIAERFASQDLSFDYGDGFVESAGLSLATGGDILSSEHIRPDNTSALWDDVRSFLFGADVALANLETPVSYSVPPSFVPENILAAPPLNGSREMLDRLVGGGRSFDILSTANNHSLDMGETGLRETLELLDERGIAHVGTARSPAERDEVVLLERNGLKLAFVSFTFSLNGKSLPEGKDYLVNYLRLNKPGIGLEPLRRQVEAARAAGADAVVALLHWSLEFEAYPLQSLIDTAHRVVELGVDLVLGNHAHNIQPIENYAYADPATGRTRRGLVVYAQGDLVSYNPAQPNTMLGYLARLRVSKGRAAGAEGAGDETRITSLEVRPIYHYAAMRDGSCEGFRVVDFLALRAALSSGRNPLGLGRAERARTGKLERLCRRVIGPALPR